MMLRSMLNLALPFHMMEKLDHLVKLMKGSFVSFHELISIFCQFLKQCFHFGGTNIGGGDIEWF